MVTNEVFVGAGTSATLVPEMDMFFNAGTVGNASNLDKVTLATGEQSLVQLLDNLYVGCRVKVESGSTTTFTTVKSNDRVSFTFTDDVGLANAADADITLYAFGAPVIAPKSGDVPQLLSDNWLGLVNTITPPNVEVEMKQMNLAVSGTRNFAHQYKGAETVSGGSLDISLNNGSWLYYALGNISSIAEDTASTATWDANSGDSNSTCNYVINTTSGRLLRVINGNEYPPLNFTPSAEGTHLEHDSSSHGFKEYLSNLTTYNFGELNGDVLPSFALEVLYDKSGVTNTTAIDNNDPNNTRFARLFTGCQVNTMTLNFEEGQELKTSLDLVTRRAYDVETTGTDDYIPRRSIANGASNLQNFSATVADNYPFQYSDGALKLFGHTVARVKSGSLTINNNITQQRFIDNVGRQTMSAHIPAQRTYEVSLTMLVTDTQIWDELRADGETANSTGSSKNIQLQFTKDGGEQISISLEDYMIQSVTIPFPDDKGPVEVEMTASARTLGSASYTGKWAILV